MKQIKINNFGLLKAAAVIATSIFGITNTDAVKAAVYDSVLRCLTTVIPSLYGMMIISGLLVKSNIICNVPNFIKKIGSSFFGMSGGVFPIFIFSMVAGYPIGSKMLCSEYENGNLSRHDAEIFSGICYGAGPAFIFGCISSQLYGGSISGKIIIVSTISANLILAFFLSIFLKKRSYAPSARKKIILSSETLNASILSAGRSLADICLMISAFSVFTVFLEKIGAINFAAELISKCFNIPNESCSGIIFAFLDITSVNRLPYGNYDILPIISALTSFGGVCVIMQLSALNSGKLSLKPLVLLRVCSALLSGAICHFIMPIFLANETVSAANITASCFHTASPIPSVMLIFMTIILFRDIEKLHVK